MERCLQELGYAVVPITGTSMWPLLKEGQSRVQILARADRQLRKGDVVLYRRKDGTLVLHRIIQVTEAHTYLVCGDHQWRAEERVADGQVLAVAQGFFRKNRYFDDDTWWYRIYQFLWNRSLVVRRCCLGLLRLSGLEKHSLQ